MTKLEFVKEVKNRYVKNICVTPHRNKGLCRHIALVNFKKIKNELHFGEFVYSIDHGESHTEFAYRFLRELNKHKNWLMDKIDEFSKTRMYLYDHECNTVPTPFTKETRRLYYTWRPNDSKSRIEFLDNLIKELES